ncbi:zf-HC2 domain-containing protein [Gottfriedia solisilvae]|uniref:zf-HC2 domain-containing protein n=1 Tax=Gottfriedia solisilvae TaxID=1516104 RepID=UPI003D2EAC82
MKHLTTEQLISYQLKELSNKESQLLEQHLESCSACQNELILIGELHEDWMNPTNLELSDEMFEEIMMKTEEMNKEVIKSEQHSKLHHKKRSNSKLVRLVHLSLAAAATFLFFHFQLEKQITKSNQQVVQTIEQTSNLLEKSEKVNFTIPKIWKGMSK